MDVEFAGAHMIWDGVLRCTADDPGAYYAADVRRVLELYVLAWECGVKTVYYVRSKSLEVEECESCSS